MTLTEEFVLENEMTSTVTHGARLRVNDMAPIETCGHAAHVLDEVSRPIAHKGQMLGDRDIPSAAIADNPLVFENEEWLVTAEGLEHKGTGYFIARQTLGNRRSDGLWLWPIHMAEKRWCSAAPFHEALTCAAALYQLRVDIDLAHSFNMARCEIAEWPKSAAKPCTVLHNEDDIPTSLDAAPRSSAWPAQTEATVQPARERSWSSVRRVRPRGGPLPGAAAFHWHATRPLRRASTRLVRLLQAALSRR